MRPFDGRRILLGVTGGIASYKTVMLARLLAQAGAQVDVVMTRGALEFVGAITFEAVTGRRTYSEIFGAGNALDHIKLAGEAEIFKTWWPACRTNFSSARCRGPTPYSRW